MAKEQKNAVGRPRLIKTVLEFDERVDAYISWCRSREEPILLTGMILALGMNSKDTFYSYAEYPEFSDSVKRARLLVEMEYEKRLNTNTSAAGSIFALKNFGWIDKHEVDNKSSDGSMMPAPTVIQLVTPDDDSEDYSTKKNTEGIQ